MRGVAVAVAVAVFGLAETKTALAQQPTSPRTQCIASAAASGTSDQITIPALPCGTTTNLLILSSMFANQTSTPTLQPLGSPAQTIVRQDGSPLGVGDIGAAPFRALLNPNGAVWYLLNPTNGSGVGTLSITDGTTTVAKVTLETIAGCVVTGTTPSATVSCNPGITISDGINTLTNVQSLTFTGLTVGGTNLAATAKVNFAALPDIWGGATGKAIDPNGANGAIAPVLQAETGGVFSINFQTGINVFLPLVHADCPCTVANPTGVYPGLSGNMEIAQSSSGGDTIGTWGSVWKFSNGVKPTLSTGANTADFLPFYCPVANFCVLTFVGNLE